MSWAARRRFLILLIVGAVAVAFLAIILIATFYKTPTCSDGAQNQDEAGVDCGGACAYLCTPQVQPPTVLFTKAITNSEGRTDIVASVENKNTTAGAKKVPYTVSVYGANQVLLQKISGLLDLAPGATQLVYIPGVLTDGQAITTAFLSIDTAAPKWFTLGNSSRLLPEVSNIAQIGSLNAPRIEALLLNRSVAPLTNVKLIVVVRDAKSEVIAASQTIVPLIPAQGETTAIFTWNSAFTGVPAAIQVMPDIPLP